MSTTTTAGGDVCATDLAQMDQSLCPIGCFWSEQMAAYLPRAVTYIGTDTRSSATPGSTETMGMLFTTVMAGPLLLVVYPARLLEKHLRELDKQILRRDDEDREASDASILLALVHDATQAYSVLSAGLDALGAGWLVGGTDALVGELAGAVGGRRA